MRLPLVIFLVALAVRVLFALEMRGDPMFTMLAVDARSYFELAGRFASGDWFYGSEALWFAPLYPTLVGLLFRVVGPQPSWAIAIQFVLGAVTASLAAGLGARVSRAAGVTAGLLMALSPVVLFYEGQLLYTSLGVFFSALFLARLVAGMDAKTVRSAAGAGAVLGLLGLVRSNALVFLPFGALLLWRRVGKRQALGFAAATVVVLAPVFLRNGLVAGTWTKLSVNGGMIFATGFAEGALGGRALQRRPEDFWPDGAFHREAEEALGRELSLAEASAYHRRQAVERIRADPAAAARLTLRKVGLLLTSRELDDNLSFSLVRGRAWALRWPAAPWAWFVLPAVFGAAVAVRRRDRTGDLARTLTIYSAIYCGSLLPFFVNARYRMPLAVPAAVLAGVAVDAVVRAWPGRSRRPLALPAAAMLLAAFLVLRDPGVRTNPALGLVAIGAALERDGRHAEALGIMDRAVALDPSVAGAHQNRAVSLLALGRPGEAYDAAVEAARLDPTLAAAWMTQGAILARDGRIADALPAFRKAVDLSPDDPAALENLALALAETGRRDEALEVGRRAVAAGSHRLERLLAEWERGR